MTLPLPRTAAAEAVTVWAFCFAAILVGFLSYPPAGKVIATVGFLYLPLLAGQARGEDWAEFGFSTRTLKADVKQFLQVGAVIFPLFIAGYVISMWALPNLPREWTRIFTPYTTVPHFELRLPPRFAEWVIDDLFVVAIPEELFYRGYIQTRLRDAWPQGRMFFGARLGPAFWLTAVLFALGHLAIFQAWRLAVFFPALIFGWMRERNNSIIGAALLHGFSNLLVKVLDASFFG